MTAGHPCAGARVEQPKLRHRGSAGKSGLDTRRRFGSPVLVLALGALLVSCSSGAVQSPTHEGTTAPPPILGATATVALVKGTPTPPPTPTSSPSPKPTPAIAQLPVIACGVTAIYNLDPVAGGQRLGTARVAQALLGALRPATLALFTEAPYAGERLSLADAILAPRSWKCLVSGGDDDAIVTVSPTGTSDSPGITTSETVGGFDYTDVVDACQHHPVFRTAFLKADDPMNAELRPQCEQAKPDGTRIPSDQGSTYAYQVSSAGIVTYSAMSWSLEGSTVDYLCRTPAAEALCLASRALFYVPSSVH
jgi:hypothetical protein